ALLHGGQRVLEQVQQRLPDLAGHGQDRRRRLDLEIDLVLDAAAGRLVVPLGSRQRQELLDHIAELDGLGPPHTRGARVFLPPSTVDMVTRTGRGSPARVISRISPWNDDCRICAVRAGTSWAVDRKSVQGRPRRLSPVAPTISRKARLAKITQSSASTTATPSPIRRTTSARYRASPSSRA